MDILKSIGVGYPKIFFNFLYLKIDLRNQGHIMMMFFKFSRNNLPMRNNLDIKHLPKVSRVSRVPREKHM